MYDEKFSRSLHYSPGHLVIFDKLVNAMCRICRDVGDPSNGLVQPNGASCFPGTLYKYITNPYNPRFPDCRLLASKTNHTALTVNSLLYVDSEQDNAWMMKSVVMAFRSVSTPALSFVCVRYSEFLITHHPFICRNI